MLEIAAQAIIVAVLAAAAFLLLRPWAREVLADCRHEDCCANHFSLRNELADAIRARARRWRHTCPRRCAGKRLGWPEWKGEPADVNEALAQLFAEYVLQDCGDHTRAAGKGSFTRGEIYQQVADGIETLGRPGNDVRARVALGIVSQAARRRLWEVNPPPCPRCDNSGTHRVMRPDGQVFDQVPCTDPGYLRRLEIEGRPREDAR